MRLVNVVLVAVLIALVYAQVDDFMSYAQTVIINVPNTTTLGEGVRLYLVNSVQTIPPQQPFRVGEQMEFPWAVQNTGTVTLTNVVVTTTLDSGTSNFISEDCTILGSDVTCLIPDLVAGERYPASGFFRFAVTIEPELNDSFYFNTGRVCGTWEAITYCASDRSAAIIQDTITTPIPDPIPDPEPEPDPILPNPPVLEVTVDGLKFDFKWTQDSLNGVLPISYKGEYYVTENNVIIQPLQNLEKTCPSINIGCGPFNIQGNIGTYTHTHEVDGVFGHCFFITAVWEEFGEIAADVVCSETISIPDVTPPDSTTFPDLETRFVDIENRLSVLEGQQLVDITDLENRVTIVENDVVSFNLEMNRLGAIFDLFRSFIVSLSGILT